MKIHTLLQSIVTDVVVDTLYHIGYPIEGHHGPKEFCKYYLSRFPIVITKDALMESKRHIFHHLNLDTQAWTTSIESHNAIVINVGDQWYVVPKSQISKYRYIQYKGIK